MTRPLIILCALAVLAAGCAPDPGDDQVEDTPMHTSASRPMDPDSFDYMDLPVCEGEPLISFCDWYYTYCRQELPLNTYMYCFKGDRLVTYIYRGEQCVECWMPE